MSAGVLLIQPPLKPEELYTRGSRATASLLPPLGLAYVAAYLKSKGHRVRVLDGIVDPLPLEEIANIARDYDVVGITVISSYVIRVIELIKSLKQAGISAPIVVGGPHATALPETLLKHGADYAVIGEGEETMLELVEKKGPETIKGLKFYDSKKNLVSTGRRRLIEPMDQIPMPARELLPMHRYRTSIARASAEPSHSMMGSRGCLGRCTFCSRMTFGNRVRYFSTDRIIEEFWLLRDRYGAKEVAVWDDDFVADPDAAVNVCERLIHKGFDRPWSASVCIETINRELLQIMQRAGCNYIAYGVESGSQRMLDRLKKKISKDEIREVIRTTKQLGIPIRAYFILGFPGETAAEMEETIEFARELDVDLASFTMFIPLPGTREYQRAKESGTFDPEYFFKMMIPEINFPDRPVYVPSGMDAGQFMKIHQRAYNRVYLRPRVILRKLAAGLKSPGEFLVLFKGARTLLSNMLWRSDKL
jgi:radical SAM superfamily enzyme YgiQ (UPF0313 family)